MTKISFLVKIFQEKLGDMEAMHDSKHYREVLRENELIVTVILLRLRMNQRTEFYHFRCFSDWYSAYNRCSINACEMKE